MDESEKRDDGVNESGLDYRAGWVEALSLVMQIINTASLRSTNKELPGLSKAYDIVVAQRKMMIEKMKGK